MGCAVKLSCIVNLFPFAQWQHCFDATLVNKQTHKLLKSMPKQLKKTLRKKGTIAYRNVVT